MVVTNYIFGLCKWLSKTLADVISFGERQAHFPYICGGSSGIFFRFHVD